MMLGRLGMVQGIEASIIMCCPCCSTKDCRGLLKDLPRTRDQPRTAQSCCEGTAERSMAHCLMGRLPGLIDSVHGVQEDGRLTCPAHLSLVQSEPLPRVRPVTNGLGPTERFPMPASLPQPSYPLLAMPFTRACVGCGVQCMCCFGWHLGAQTWIILATPSSLRS